eukprot:NODE_8442_length_678_cov_22.037838_g7819_i0.p1 GENE.NODE_8442_length_678_cov_22.037838_g7819_i0~~NODE_8442_length_678_cov_22.037838_g7819_i0.p1  ORF type:complete len:197 (+),score=10.52 NODE_8442_length_678_cov_22.037838_g7819_i0:47-592(+)
MDYISLPSKGRSPVGLLDAQVDWGDKAGKCYECWKLEPCCGNPCNFTDGIYCLACFVFCGPCTAAKICAYSLDQHCAFCNHFMLPYLLVSLPFALTAIKPALVPIGYIGAVAYRSIIRHNIREKYGVVVDSPINAWLGDVLCTLLFSPCTYCQELRSMPKEGWDWLNKEKTLVAPECKIIR